MFSNPLDFGFRMVPRRSAINGRYNVQVNTYSRVPNGGEPVDSNNIELKGKVYWVPPFLINSLSTPIDFNVTNTSTGPATVMQSIEVPMTIQQQQGEQQYQQVQQQQGQSQQQGIQQNQPIAVTAQQRRFEDLLDFQSQNGQVNILELKQNLEMLNLPIQDVAVSQESTIENAARIIRFAVTEDPLIMQNVDAWRNVLLTLYPVAMMKLEGRLQFGLYRRS